MNKRLIIFFCVCVSLFGAMFCRLYYVATNTLYNVGNCKNTVTVEVVDERGGFYDCNMEKITNQIPINLACIVSTTKSIQAINNNFEPEKAKEIIQRLSAGKPILIEVDENFPQTNGVTLFTSSERYSQNQLASHIIGYLDSSNISGVVGLEKSYDEWLNKNKKKISVTYEVDARGQVLVGEEAKIIKENEFSKQGVQLTIDLKLQEAVENYIKEINSGAIVVMDVHTGGVKAMASLPNYNSLDVSQNLNDLDSPFLNRATQGYSLGSIFKMVVTASALENNVSIDGRGFNCNGSVQVSSNVFSCYNHTQHGEIDLSTALQKSCNCYFIKLAEKIGAEKLLETAEKFGFGKSTELSPNNFTACGILPTVSEIDSPSALANLAFGQGSLLVTPLQVASVVSCIANNGVFVEPKLVNATIDVDGKFVYSKNKQSYTAISAFNAITLQNFMIDSAENGYKQTVLPEFGGCGGKSATAQSGWFENEREVVHTWFAGFYPAQSPKYAIVVMKENGKFGVSDCGPIFKKIADEIYSLDLD